MSEATKSDDSYLLRFEDGPMSRRHNINNLAGTSGNTSIPADVFGWPLPDRLGTLSHEGVENVAFWDADDPAASELPEEILDSPNAVIYRKVSESRLPPGLSHVVRGALYCQEKS